MKNRIKRHLIIGDKTSKPMYPPIPIKGMEENRHLYIVATDSSIIVHWSDETVRTWMGQRWVTRFRHVAQFDISSGLCSAWVSAPIKAN